MIFRCKHRHTINEHPTCFVNNTLSEKEYVKTSGKAWYTYPGYKIGYLDVETSQLYANTGYMLTWCIKEKGGDVHYGVINKRDILNYTFDKKLVQSLIDTMKKFKIIVTYYGTAFDIPFIRTRALVHNLDFPAFGDIYTWDLYYTVKSKLRLPRNTLEAACSICGIEGKTHLDWRVWQLASIGDKKSLEEVLTHNKYDVIILEQLHDRLSFARKWTKTSI